MLTYIRSIDRDIAGSDQTTLHFARKAVTDSCQYVICIADLWDRDSILPVSAWFCGDDIDEDGIKIRLLRPVE